ncbi:hypothetical protein [Enterococcus sp. AZ189]|uniref:hypothetical protein n=1 Tax=Enterococcus sp. AZ189 TaxID=2774871 RepID=UPI003F685666
MAKVLAVAIWILAIGGFILGIRELLDPVIVSLIFCYFSIAVGLFGLGWTLWNAD